MLRASLRIRRQLAQTPGCLRFASLVTSPREFWTLTVWRTRQEMLDFMRSGAHEDIMWEFARWLDSFWLMRWRPSSEEAGDWKGLQLAQRRGPPPAAPARTREQEAALEAAYDALPRLRAAAGPSGAPEYEYSPAQRRQRRLVSGGVGGTLRLELPTSRQVWDAWRTIRSLRSSLLKDQDVQRCAAGFSSPRQLYLLAIFRHTEAWKQFDSSSSVRALRERWPDGVWTMRWDADNEFGHWDGLRMRRVKLGTKVAVPEAAQAAASLPGESTGAETKLARQRRSRLKDQRTRKRNRRGPKRKRPRAREPLD